MRSLLILPLVFLAIANVQATDLFAKGDVKAGKALHDKSCTGCHASLLGGDGSAMYTRPDRKVDSQQKLRARISICNTNANAHWFPEEELDVGAYLNKQYYHFKK